MRAALIILAAGMSVVACDGLAPTTTSSPSETVSVVEKTIPTLPEGAVIYSAAGGVEGLSVPDYLSATVADGVMTLSGEDALASTRQKTSGASVRLTDKREKSVSGKTVIVSVVARATSPTATGLNVAYSTNEVGNSGWQSLEFSDEFSVQAFTYDVPEMSEGKGDFVGLSPVSGPIEIASIGVSTKAKEPAE